MNDIGNGVVKKIEIFRTYMIYLKKPCADIKSIDELVFKPCNFSLKNIEPETESQEYSAHCFQLDEKQILFRVAKITPTKTGQFVAIWKRNAEGITAPFEVADEFDFYLIATKTATNFGVFIFPKKILHENKILSDQTRDGKRGIRVYPIWDETTSKQAQKTQIWQTKYFLDLSNPGQIDLNRAKNLLKIE